MSEDQDRLPEPATTPYVGHPVGGVGGCVPLTEGAAADPMEWRVEDGAKLNYEQLGCRLARAGDLYRCGRTGAGLILARSTGETCRITRAADLAPVLADRVKVVVMKNGKVQGELPPQVHLNAMLEAEAFLAHFPAVDQVARHPMYRPDFTPVRPGYDPDDRLLYLGPGAEVAVSRSGDMIDADGVRGLSVSAAGGSPGLIAPPSSPEHGTGLGQPDPAS